MKYYCLNLTRASERREQMKRLWVEERGFELEFFTGVDRRQLEAGDFPLPYDPVVARTRCGRDLSIGEVACATSHYLLLRRAQAEGAVEIVVMEDDIVPGPQATPAAFYEVIQTCRSTFPQVSALLLHEVVGRMKEWETRRGITLLSIAPVGFRCVWLNRSGIDLLARELATLSCPADWFWRRRFAPMKAVAMTVAPFCFHEGDDTYIGNDVRAAPQRRFLP